MIVRAWSRKSRPEVVEPDASRQARQKLRAQLRLELLDVPGQRGLGNPDLVRSAGDATFIRDLHEVLDAAQFHGLGPFQVVLAQR